MKRCLFTEGFIFIEQHVAVCNHIDSVFGYCLTNVVFLLDMKSHTFAELFTESLFRSYDIHPFSFFLCEMRLAIVLIRSLNGLFYTKRNCKFGFIDRGM